MVDIYLNQLIDDSNQNEIEIKAIYQNSDSWPSLIDIYAFDW